MQADRDPFAVDVHQDLLRFQNAMGALLLEMGRPNAALEHFRRVLATCCAAMTRRVLREHGPILSKP